MFEHMTAQEAAENGMYYQGGYNGYVKNHINKVLNVNRVWLIPKETDKLADARHKS